MWITLRVILRNWVDSIQFWLLRSHGYWGNLYFTFFKKDITWDILQWRSIAMVHFKHQFWLSSNWKRTNNSTKTNYISFESPDDGHLNSRRRRVWHYQGLAKPTDCKKCTFWEKKGVETSWDCHAPVILGFYCPKSEV